MMLSRQATSVTLRLPASRQSLVSIRHARSYAQAIAQDTKPPVALYGLDGTYASALVRSIFC